jgi:hypothetical protein
MNCPTLFTTATLPLPNSISRSPLPRRRFSEGGSLITYHYSFFTIFRLCRSFLLIPLACVALSPAPKAFGVTPAPDGGYPGNNTAEGEDALLNLAGGTANTATGFEALFSNTTGSSNTAQGYKALYFNIGNNNMANGVFALYSNTRGFANTANGVSALASNITGSENTANGLGALQTNTTGGGNTADGAFALATNKGGSFNIALGSNAGYNLTTGSNNVDIGNAGVAGESGRIRIGTAGKQTDTLIAGIYGKTIASGAQVIIGSGGKLGTIQSSARFKEVIKPMDKASEAILALKPVTFRYKHELDPEGIPQFGLVAEQVEKVNPDLVARDETGQVYTVRYEAVNAMLLNEFLKEHRTVQDLKSTVARQEVTIAQQQKDFQSTIAKLQEQIEVLTATVQKVSDRLELNKPAPQLVADNQ